MTSETLPTSSGEATIRAISFLVLFACLASLPRAAAAQREDATPRPGDRVRLWAPFSGLAGDEAVWVGRRDGELRLRPDGEVRTVPVRDVERLEVERRTGSHLGVGALIGGITGATLTTGFLVVYCSDPDTVCDAEEVLLASAYFGLPPLGVGSLVGLAVGRHEWLEVELGRRGGGSGPGPTPGAPGLGPAPGGALELRVGVAVPVGG